MNITDIMQLVLLCAIVFIPLGYFAHRWLPRLTALIRLLFLKPRYVKPAGTLRRPSVKADHPHD
ncbi:cellulose biosynthesis protein BcsF [Enterobacteriaceae bacterium H20N1]|uniref:Cellulose biosynthesis protein BcsF n=1 Tax=Dryocola boscaweniae TaxID=2925397 RepID=A0A9X3AQN6_9ENTR|nr:cellulose biosynthesis protein BcsF [Dryocola boscaweniae]MCT4703325.1 cellulose biosynthesis protein BcsF [Dryocola boscaweniae]MCT4715717.1 cellulose biosynthesis protein BcsF [Dryocola boscaweniae]MCT4720493.1 cellulose biosynthesis protein BcsF [Dryocola boscaweniae]